MAFFSDLGETLTETGKEVSQKVKGLTGIAKLNLEVKKKEEFIQKQYREIGRQYYELHKDDEDPFLEEIMLIRETMKEIEQLKSEIAELKGTRICSACGAVIEQDAVFCKMCGEKCDSIVDENPVAAEVENMEGSSEEDIEAVVEENVEEPETEEITEEP